MKIHERFESQFREIKNTVMRDTLVGIDTLEYESPSYGIFNPNQTIFIGNDTTLIDIFNVFSRFRISQFVQMNRPDFLNSLYLGAALLKYPGRFMQAPYLVLFPNPLSAQEPVSPPPKAMEFLFYQYYDRSNILSQLEIFLQQSPLAYQQLDTVVLILDELMKNALWSPIDLDGRRVFSSELNSITDPKMEPHRPGKIFVIFDSSRLVIGCLDQYGSLDPNGFLDLLIQNFDSSLHEVEDLTLRSSGLGLKNMLNHCSELVVVSRRNIQTLVCCGLKLGIPGKKHSALSKNIHFHFY